MGYIMWTALNRWATFPREIARNNFYFNRNGEPRGQKSQGVIFAIYSAYVWGLALALVTVGFIYDQYHPLTSACFWETLHGTYGTKNGRAQTFNSVPRLVKMFMDLPNIVLQLLNNVFFVPIAVHVWRRFRVVNKSADSRSGNTLDTERYCTYTRVVQYWRIFQQENSVDQNVRCGAGHETRWSFVQHTKSVPHPKLRLFYGDVVSLLAQRAALILRSSGHICLHQPRIRGKVTQQCSIDSFSSIVFRAVQPVRQARTRDWIDRQRPWWQVYQLEINKNGVPSNFK